MARALIGTAFISNLRSVGALREAFAGMVAGVPLAAQVLVTYEDAIYHLSALLLGRVPGIVVVTRLALGDLDVAVAELERMSVSDTLRLDPPPPSAIGFTKGDPDDWR